MKKRKKSGPAPILKRPVMVRVAINGADVRAIDAYARAKGINRSEVVRRAVALWLGSPMEP